jgi:hypothetical protein
MSGVIKIYGIAFMALIIILFSIEYQKKIIISNDLEESVKTTQSSVIVDSLNMGELRVNNQYSIDREITINNWIERFNVNRDLNLNYVIEVVDLNENPPAIAINVKAYTKRNLSKDSLMFKYSNIVIIDR